MQKENHREHYIQEDEIDLRELFKTIASYKKFIAIFTIIITVVMSIYISLKTPIYEVSSIVEIGSYQDNSTEKQILNIDKAIKALQVPFIITKNQKAWIKSIKKKGNNLIEITANSTSIDLAQKEVERVIKFIKNREIENIDNIISIGKNNVLFLDKKIEVIQDSINYLENQLKSTNNQGNGTEAYYLATLKIQKLDIEKNKTGLTNPTILKNAEIVKLEKNNTPIKPKKRLVIIVAFVTALILSIFIIFFIEFIKGGKEEERD